MATGHGKKHSFKVKGTSKHEMHAKKHGGKKRGGKKRHGGKR